MTQKRANSIQLSVVLISLPLFLALLPLAVASASETVLSISSDILTRSASLAVERDEQGAVKDLVFGEEDQVKVLIDVSHLQQGPKVIKEYNGRQAILLSAEADFEPTKGGHINVRFLHDGILGSYRHFRILVEIYPACIQLRSDPNPEDPRSDHNAYTGPFNHLFIKRKTFLGKLVGIRSVHPSLAEVSIHCE